MECSLVKERARANRACERPEESASDHVSSFLDGETEIDMKEV